MKERVNFVLEWERRWNEGQGGPIDIAALHASSASAARPAMLGAALAV